MLINEIALNRTKPYMKSGAYNDICAMIQRNASEAIAANENGHTIFRGLRSGYYTPTEFGVYLVNPSTKIRPSRNTTNYYTLFIDNLPAWERFPKRSRSIICANQVRAISSYGDTFVVLPFNGATIGICPEDDMWDSFYCYNEEEGFHLPWLNRGLFEMGVQCRNYTSMLSQILAHKDQIQKLAKAIDQPWIIPPIKNATTINDIVNVFNQLMDPQHYGFSAGIIDDIPTKSSREVWTSSKSYMIRTNSRILMDLGI